MSLCQILFFVGFALLQICDANAQLGGFGNLIKKVNEKQAARTNPPAATDQKIISDTAANPTNSDDSGKVNNPQNNTTTGAKDASLSLPPIFEAAKKCDDAKFSELLKKDISVVNKKLYDMNWGRDGKDRYVEDRFRNRIYNYTLLDFAAANGCTNIIGQLLDMDVEVNPSTISPISLAAGNGHLEAVKMLLKAKADPQTAMSAAVKNGNIEVLQMLIDVGAGGGENLLKESVANGQIEIVKTLLRLKKNPGATDEYGYTRREAFRSAIEKGNLDIVKAFVVADEEVSDSRDEDDRKMLKDTLAQTAINANQSDILLYLKQVKKTQAAELVDKKAAMAKEEAAKQEKATTIQNQAVQKKVLSLLDHPADLFGMANSRFRRFNGTVYDCAEPIDFLNRLFAFIPIEAQYNENPNSLKEIKDRVEAESNYVHTSSWYKIWSQCSISPVLVKKVTPDGLIVRLNSQRDVELLVLLKNHPKQKSVVDGDAIIDQLFVIRTSPYQYTDVLGVIRTIPSYDMGVIVPTPSGSVPKLPVPDIGR